MRTTKEANSRIVTNRLKAKINSSDKMKMFTIRCHDSLLNELDVLTKYKFNVDRSTLIRVAMWLITFDELAPLIHWAIQDHDWTGGIYSSDSLDEAILKCVKRTKILDGLD